MNIQNFVTAFALSVVSVACGAQSVQGNLDRPYVLHHADGTSEYHHEDVVTTMEVGSLWINTESNEEQNLKASGECAFEVEYFEFLGRFGTHELATAAFAAHAASLSCENDDVCIGMQTNVRIVGCDVLKVASN